MAIVVVCLACPAVDVRADETDVPIALQVELLARLLWYERGLQRDPDKQLAILVVERAGDHESARSAAQLEAQLDRIAQLGGKAVRHLRVSYESPEQVTQLAEQQHVYAIYLSQGLGTVAPALARALEGHTVLTVSAGSGDAERGAVLAFELVSSKPRITFNLSRARAQRLDFSAQFMRVARVLP